MKTTEVKNRYFGKVNIEELHKESRFWLSSFDFWKDEVKFMHNLINKNFVFFLAKDKHHTLQFLVDKISKVENDDLLILKEKVIKHEQLIAEYVKHVIKPDKENFLIQHINILNEIERFQNNYRLLKTELFRMGEEVIKEKNYKMITS